MGAIQKWVVAAALTDPYVVVYAARVSVWGRWFVWLVGVFLLAYRPGFWYPEDIEFLSIPVLLFVTNGLVHHRLLTNRPITWRWMLFLCAMDIALITTCVVIDGGFSSFIFLAYYPALAIFAVVFPSSRLSLAWTTTIAVAYPAVCLMVDSGLDLGAGKEKAPLAAKRPEGRWLSPTPYLRSRMAFSISAWRRWSASSSRVSPSRSVMQP